MKVDLREIYGAPTRAAAEAAIDVFADKYNAKHDKAVACLTKDREALLAFLDFPAEHWSDEIDKSFLLRDLLFGSREPGPRMPTRPRSRHRRSSLAAPVRRFVGPRCCHRLTNCS